MLTVSCLQREQRRKELLEKERAAAELKRLEEAEAARTAAAESLLILPAETLLPVQAADPPATVAPESPDTNKENANGNVARSPDGDDGSDEEDVAAVLNGVWISRGSSA